MQRLNTLWNAVEAISTVTELARQSQTYTFNVEGTITFYLQTENAEVRFLRWEQPKVEVTAQLQAAFGWRIVTDQDAAGVYMVARRKPVVGSVSSARFTIVVPLDAYLLLKLADCRLVLEHLDGTLDIPPLDVGRQMTVGHKAY